MHIPSVNFMHDLQNFVVGSDAGSFKVSDVQTRILQRESEAKPARQTPAITTMVTTTQEETRNYGGRTLQNHPEPGGRYGQKFHAQLGPFGIYIVHMAVAFNIVLEPPPYYKLYGNRVFVRQHVAESLGVESVWACLGGLVGTDSPPPPPPPLPSGTEYKMFSWTFPTALSAPDMECVDVHEAVKTCVRLPLTLLVVVSLA
jgi:hypothetical protein